MEKRELMSKNGPLENVTSPSLGDVQMCCRKKGHLLLKKCRHLEAMLGRVFQVGPEVSVKWK